MPLIDMSDVVNDQDLAQAYSVTRSVGSFVLGGFHVDSTSEIPFWGVIQPSTPEEIELVPEADRKTGMMTFHSQQQMFSTYTEGIGTASGLSDVIVWRGQPYRLTVIDPWGDFAYWRAIGTRLAGA
jgi:hypothetical protein